MVEVYLSIGSNLNNREDNLYNGLKAIAIQPDIVLKDVSSFYETEPVGLKSQALFLNTACKLITDLPAPYLLEITQGIEKSLGRENSRNSASSHAKKTICARTSS